MILVFVFILNLLDEGKHVELDGSVVAASIRVDEACIEGVLLIGAVIVSSPRRIVKGESGGAEKSSSKRYLHFYFKILL